MPRISSSGLFCLFAENIGLLPNRMFTRHVENSQGSPDQFRAGVRGHFGAMATGGMFGVESLLPWFNGGLREPEWPSVYAILGNPPFLGGNRMLASMSPTTASKG